MVGFHGFKMLDFSEIRDFCKKITTFRCVRSQCVDSPVTNATCAVSPANGAIIRLQNARFLYFPGSFIMDFLRILGFLRKCDAFFAVSEANDGIPSLQNARFLRNQRFLQKNHYFSLFQETMRRFPWHERKMCGFTSKWCDSKAPKREIPLLSWITQHGFSENPRISSKT
jgi:hypothetical protein